MRKLLIVFLLIFLPISAFAADTKVVDETAITSVAGGDIFYCVDDPGGTPLDRKCTFTQAQTFILTGEAATATALAANGGNCAAGEYPLGVNTLGAVESCTDATTEIDAIIASDFPAIVAENGAEELLGETLGTACAENQILKTNATGGLDCAADNGGAEINDLESVATSAGNAEIFVGTGADAGAYITGLAACANDEKIDYVPGSPDTFTCGAIGGLVDSDIGDIALGSGTSGNYADGDAEAGAALTGDSATAFFSSGEIADAQIADNITASSYLPLAGGTMTGALIADEQGIEFLESDDAVTCAAGDFWLRADLSELVMKKCEDGSETVMDTSGGAPPMDSVGTVELDDGTDTPLVGEFVVVATGALEFEYRTDAEVLSDIGAEGTLTNEAGLYSALGDVTNFLQTGDALAGDDITDGSIDSSELATDSVRLDELDDSADTPVAGEALFVASGAANVEYNFIIESFCIAISDETTAITTGTAKVTMRMPYAFTLTEVRGSLNTVSSSGAPIFDIHESGTTIMTTDKILIDVSELTSETAATAPTITDADLADDAEITFDIDTAGTGAKGAKICMIGHQ